MTLRLMHHAMSGGLNRHAIDHGMRCVPPASPEFGLAASVQFDLVLQAEACRHEIEGMCSTSHIHTIRYMHHKPVARSTSDRACACAADYALWKMLRCSLPDRTVLQS